MVSERYLLRDSRRCASSSPATDNEYSFPQHEYQTRGATRRENTSYRRSLTEEVEKSTISTGRRSSRLTRYHTKRYQDDDENADVDEDHDNDGLGNGTVNDRMIRSAGSGRNSRRAQKNEPEEKDMYTQAGSYSKFSKNSSENNNHSTRDHEDHRRSLRMKKLLHNTYNEAELLKPPRHPDEEMEDSMDMYTRVKRARRRVKRDMYGMVIHDEDNQTEEDATTENDEDEDGEEGSDRDDDDEGQRAQYNLRQHKPKTKLYEATIEKKRQNSIFTPTKRKYRVRNDIQYKSPAHKSHRRKRASHRSSSTSSSASSTSDDEKRFSRRKAKSMAKARQRCLPMNLKSTDLSMVMKDRQKIGASLADIDPMTVDRTITFESVGGLTDHIQSLKEMIVFPLLYPEVFEKFKIAPPRGVLFYGPPGTGKTLVARALANECSSGEKKVAFFMRKGADCLSKWVGESERQLRLLFDQAYQLRPSIIFFDEIDGLAPVRSSRQDQIHSSIVSTLLALMDGLDSRGEVVVIGATNRIDSIDPALRRPGRFDREFLFTLPSAEARADILRIHTKDWNPKLVDKFIVEVASKCNGYCGADMKALCTEAALHALKRRYPQIYTSSDKLQLDVTSIDINAGDFLHAIGRIVPAGQRAIVSPARPLSPIIKPLLSQQLETVLQMLSVIYPFGESSKNSGSLIGDLLDCVDEHASASCVTECTKMKRKSKQPPESTAPYLDFTVAAYRQPIVCRPRILLHGQPSQGHTTHLAPAVLHGMEKMPTQVLDIPTLFGNSSKTPEESCAQVFREARRTTPSIIYIPNIDSWWHVLSDTMKATFMHIITEIDPLMPILVLATSDVSPSDLPLELLTLFSTHETEHYKMLQPSINEIRLFFKDLLLNQTCVPPVTKKQAARNLLEVLPKAPASKPAQLTETEEKLLWDQEEAILRELRLFLREMLNKLAGDRKFNIFAKPVDEEEVPDYYNIIKSPMDLTNMMAKIDLHQYQSCKDFLEDIDLICSNALEYNPDDTTTGRAIRHRACALKDTAHALIDAELDEEFEKRCIEILESRRKRGRSPSKTAPKFYHTKRLLENGPLSNPTRYSRRLRQEDAEEVSSDIQRVTGPAQSDSQKDVVPEPSPDDSDERKPPKKRRRKGRWAKGMTTKKCHKKSEHQELESGESSEDDLPDELNESKDSNLETELLNNPAENSTTPEKPTATELSHAKKDLLAELNAVDQCFQTKPNQPDTSANSNTQCDEKLNKENELSRNTQCEQGPGAQSPRDENPVIHETVMELEPSQIQPMRLTRSITNDPHILQCIEILEEAVPSFYIDYAALPVLLEKAVKKGKECSLVELEKLYSLLAQQIFQHRNSYDRTQLVQDLERVIENFKCKL